MSNKYVYFQTIKAITLFLYTFLFAACTSVRLCYLFSSVRLYLRFSSGRLLV